MGAYKDANGVTRAGKVLRDIGGFFSGIFKKKSTSTSTDTNTNTNTNTGSSSGATPPISGSSSKFDWGGVLVTLGTAVGGIFGVNMPKSDSTTTTDPNATDPNNNNNNNDASAKSLGTWVVVGIVSLVAGILIYVLYRKKAKA